MKLACSLLAFPNHKLISNHFDSIEWSGQMLDLLENHHQNVDTMLSLMKTSEQTPSLFGDSWIQSVDMLIEAIHKGYDKGIKKFVLGLPKIRRGNISNSQLKNRLRYLANHLNVSGITIYIENLYCQSYAFRYFKDICDLCDSVNHWCDDIYKPLLDLGTLLRTNEKIDLNDLKTDRVHISYSDNTIPFKERDYSHLNFDLKDLVNIKNLTVSYEHVNTDENESYKHFEEFFQKHAYQNDTFNIYDIVIIGAGIYGRYISSQLKTKNALIIAKDDCLEFNQSDQGVASLVNQARVHNGYHYPRSIATAQSSVSHFHTFIKDFNEALICDFKKVYAIPKFGSLTSARQFANFCKSLNVKCDEYLPDCLNSETIEKSYLTEEYSIDTKKMMSIMSDLTKHKVLNSEVIKIERIDEIYHILLSSGEIVRTKMIINAAYAGLKQINDLIPQHSAHISVTHELCEIALFESPTSLDNHGVTFMDGPFVSCMPFSDDGKIWSLTSVLHTPHCRSNDHLILNQTSSKKDVMIQILKQYVKPGVTEQMRYIRSEYVIKTIPANSENDDNRLVQIAINNDFSFISALSGKLNAIYDLQHIIERINEKYE